MNFTEHQIYLGALLHDIGKFYQRADKGLSEKNELSQYSKNLADSLCKAYDNGGYGYQHVLWTNEFLTKHEKLLGSIPEIRNGASEDSLVNFACNHHRPKTLLQGIITLADWYSAGIDRTTIDTENNNHPPINWGKQRYKKIPLYSIFNTINGGKHNSGFNLHAINLENIFPHDIEDETDGNSENSYNKLWKDFCDEFEKLPSESYQSFTESLLHLLKKYTWTIPSNTNDMADVSLYEHLKTTAAFAHCIFCHYEENPEYYEWDGANGKLKISNDSLAPVLLVAGDISGIQNFIYDITSSKASRSLKGRSFYLQLLTDSAINRILSHPDINATSGQIVYSSGGKFFMLLPNTKKANSALDDLKTYFENELWNINAGQLSLAIERIPFSYDIYTGNGTLLISDNKDKGNIGTLWKTLSDKLAIAKNRKFESVLSSNFNTLFTPKETGDRTKICAITGIESDKCIKISDSDDEDIYVLPIVKDQIELGKALMDTDYIISSNEEIKPLSSVAFRIDIFGIQHYLFKAKDAIRLNATYENAYYRIKAINSTNMSGCGAIKEKLRGIPSYGFQFYGGNKQATVYNRYKTFEELADESYLGVLRMDVDGLGAIFIQGLPETRRSFAAYSTLSFLLDYYFSGYINVLREKNEYAEYLNILYSGGDDIFAIGRWDRLILFAEEIRKDFARFTGRKDISISGGLVIINPKFPISKAAELAGDAEDSAKKYNDGEKNAINMFGHNISWNDFAFVKEWKTRFVTLCDKDNMPRSILHRMMSMYLEKAAADIAVAENKPTDKSYVWRSLYFLNRFKENKSQDIKSLCDELSKIFLEKSNRLEHIAVAARWAEVELRETNKEQ